MSLYVNMKEFIQQRLSAAAEDILEAFKNVISDYEEQIVCQQRLLEKVSKTQRAGEFSRASVDPVFYAPLFLLNSVPSIDP